MSLQSTVRLRPYLALIAGAHGSIIDVVPAMAAALAGIGPGMKLTAVNGRRCSLPILYEAVRAAKSILA